MLVIDISCVLPTIAVMEDVGEVEIPISILGTVRSEIILEVATVEDTALC